MNLNEIKVRRDIDVISKSNLFEVDYYKKQFDVNINEPIEHYVRFGWEMDKNPNKNFNTRNYLEANPDVDKVTDSINPFVHWILYGKKEKKCIDKTIIIITRHVTSSETNEFWKICYDSIREIYPKIKIIIIDDNSPYREFGEKQLVNCETIESEFPRRGELLPYYYFHKFKLADKAIVLHDSVFINKQININNIKTFKFLWDFRHNWDNDQEILKIMEKLENKDDIINFYKNKDKWKGCFGVMSIIKWEFLDIIDKKFNFFNIMIDNITDREKRMCLERIYACICTYLDQDYESIYGCINEWNYKVTNGNTMTNPTYTMYVSEKKYMQTFPIIKIGACR